MAADSLRVTRRIVAQPALARYSPEEHLPGAQFTSDEELVREGAQHREHHFSPGGHGAHGRRRRPGAVVDSHLRVRGVGGSARGRRQHHAHDHQRQYQQPDAHDRREGGALDLAGD